MRTQSICLALFIAIVLVQLFAGLTPCFTQTTFERRYSPMGSESGAYSVQQTLDGGYIIAGWIQSLGPSNSHVYVIKTNSLGDTLWTRTYGGFGAGESVQQTSDGGYIIAGYADVSAPSGGKVYLIKTLADGLVSVTVDHNIVPKVIVLRQNYPNPFNPSTTIKYELPRASQVNLSVYDVLGREVAVLANERRDAGVHEVKFDGTGLSSGVYFYRIEAGSFVQTRKLLLLK